MTSWRDDLHRVKLADNRQMIGGSFRGVPFLVEASQRAGGRRIVTHEFPLANSPYVDDLGRRARTFPVEAYVLGADYVQQRDKLLAALEDEEGPGELVHPYYGVLRAICSSFSVRESTGEGGVARFAIEFTETPAQFVEVTGQADVAEELFLSADTAALAAGAEFEEAFDIGDLPAFAVASAADVLGAMAEGLGAALGPIVASTQEMARLDLEVRSITSQATALIRAPADVLGAFGQVLGDLAETVAGSPGAVLRALVDAYAVDIGVLAPNTTGTRQRERANQVALASALRRVLAIEATKLATKVTFDSHEDAIAARDELAALLEEQAATATDELYPRLVQLRADLIRAVPGDAELASIRTIERVVSVPSLLLAYQLHGTVAGEADILARNGVPHPSFVSGELKVRSDA